MNGITLDPVVGVVLRASLSVLFAAAAWHKLRDGSAFRATLRDYQLLPAGLVPWAVPALVFAELFVAGGLWLRPWGVLAGALAVFLLGVYSLAIAVNLARGRRRIDCGCLGPASQQSISASLLVRNAVLGVGSGTVLLPTSQRALHFWVDGLTAVAGVATLVLLFVAVNQLMALTTQRAHRGGLS